MKRPHIYLTITVAAGILAVLSLFGIDPNPEVQIVGTVTDALSGDPIHGVKIIVGGRSTVRHSDKKFKITRLKPGIHKLNVSATGYESKIKQIDLKQGINLIDVRLIGKEIPDLDHIIVFADSIKAKGIQLEIRFVNKQGTGIKHFPRLKLSMHANLFGRLGTKENYQRGRRIYSGPVELSWHSEARLGKYKGLIAKDKLQKHPGGSGGFGILDVVLHTPDGDYEDTISDILLEW